MAQLKAGTTVGGKPVVTEEFEGQVATHLADGVKHITAAERTKWNQAITDIGTKANLQTSNKTNLVNAINEVFLSGNNVKSDMVAALLAVDPTLPITVNSSWVEIEAATEQITTGIREASGVLNSSSTQTSFTLLNGSTGNLSYLDILFTDLGFEPSIIYGYTQQKNWGTNNLFVWTKENYYEGGSNFANAMSNLANYRAPKLADRYRIPIIFVNVPMIWIAKE